jgi:hypothetical protein
MKYSLDDFEVSKFLGNAVGRNNPFMRFIACMSEDWREIAGYLEALKIIEPDLAKDKEFKQVEKVVQRLGQSTFKMDIVSHLSMKANSDEAIADAK